MTDHIDGWADMERAAKVRARIAYEAQPDFPAIKAEAEALGWRQAYLSELLSTEADVHTWRGGCWVRLDGAVLPEPSKPRQ